MTGSFGGVRRMAAWAGIAAVVGAPALAGAPGGALPTQYGGHTFLTVGAPGNRDMLPVERHNNINPSPVTEQIGRVDTAFRISKLEVTATQWVSFIQTAYPIWQEWGGNPDDGRWKSVHISNPSFGAPAYSVLPGHEQLAIRTTWRAAALYCNWLMAGMPTGPGVNLDVIRTGAYDISTFRRDSPNGLTGPFLDQAQRSAGATFWIPNLDEWTKAAYFDPERYAPGNPGPTWGAGPPGEPGTPPPPPGPGAPPISGETSGYWLYPYMSQEWPGFSGLPGQGLYGNGSIPVGSYLDVQTPWGALDMLGGLSEWTETVFPTELYGNGERFVKGLTPDLNFNDSYAWDITNSSTHGIRIASLVPAPSSAVAVALVAVGGRRRRTS